jgi:aminopeptidase N
MRSLSREEAGVRAALLSVNGYDVEIDLTGLLSGPELRCRCTISFSCRRPGAASFVDCCADVVSATLNGRALPAVVGGRVVLESLAADNVLVVESAQRDTSQGPGVHRAVDLSDGEAYVWTTFEPDEARFVWACFDQPDLKAPYAVTVLAPAGWVVLSNADAVVTTEAPGGARRWVFAQTRPLSTYLPVVVAGPFCQIRQEVDGYDLGLFARRSLRHRLQRDAAELFAVTRQGLKFFGDMFGLPFPERSYDQVFAPEFGGAMENYRCVVWSDTFLTVSQPTYAEREMRALYLLHELAHMWFGDMVTLRWWDDLWLNEAFAHFAAMWAAERATEYRHVWDSHLVGAKLIAYRVDQGPATHPIAQPAADAASATPSYSITYSKGASVLRQLVAFVGEDAFQDGLRAYLAQHAWGNATLADLMTALSAASGRDLDRWGRDWLQTTGPDRLSLDDQDGRLTLLATGPSGQPVRPQVVSVGAYRRTSDGLARAAGVEVDVSTPATPLPLPSGADLYLVNDRDLTYAITRPRQQDYDVILAQAGDLPDSRSRGVAASCGYDMLLSGEASAAAVVGSLCAVVLRERSPAVVESYLQLALDVAEHWSSEAIRTSLTGRVASACDYLAEDPVCRRVALRVLAGAATGDVLDRLQDDWPDDIDLQWRILSRQAELTVLTEKEVPQLLSRDQDPEAWISALVVQASLPSATDKAVVWQLLAEERTLPLSRARAVAVAFWRPGQDEMLAPYAERFLQLIPALNRSGTAPAQAYSRWLYPTHGIDATYLDRAATVAKTATPIVHSGVLERGDLVARMLHARVD